MTEVLPPSPVATLPSAETNRDVDLEFWRLVGPLAVELAAHKADFDAWEQGFGPIVPDGTAKIPQVAVEVSEANDTEKSVLAPIQEIVESGAMLPQHFPESDGPHGTISSGQYHRRLNWRLREAAEAALAGTRREPKPESARYRYWVRLGHEIRTAAQNTNPYSQVDKVKGIEEQVSNLVQRSGVE